MQNNELFVAIYFMINVYDLEARPSQKQKEVIDFHYEIKGDILKGSLRNEMPTVVEECWSFTGHFPSSSTIRQSLVFHHCFCRPPS